MGKEVLVRLVGEGGDVVSMLIRMCCIDSRTDGLPGGEKEGNSAEISCEYEVVYLNALELLRL